MCGIVGHIGNFDSVNNTIAGLKKLEYRGYDSAGIATFNNGINIFKEVGLISNLEKIVDGHEAYSSIGHTRWSTHGKSTKVNSHPHSSENKRFTIVHNGIIENYLELKKGLDTNFVSQTDSEVIAHLLDKMAKENKDITSVLFELTTVLDGSYALAIIDNMNPEKIYFMKNKSPLLIGKGSDFNMLGSDALAMIAKTSTMIEIKDGDYGYITKDAIVIKNENEVVTRNTYTSNIKSTDSELGSYEHFMIKEIEEQPKIIASIANNQLNENFIDENLIKDIKNADKLYIIAAGTSYHAGLIGRKYFEEIAKIPTETFIASEFSYNPPLITDNAMFVFISQSGETADLRACIKLIKSKNAKILTITNVDQSTLSRESDYTLLLNAGPEISVASTKAYTSQIALLYVLVSTLAGKVAKNIHGELLSASLAIEDVISKSSTIKDKVISLTSKKQKAFYIGRSLDSITALEAALKLKEISYIQTEGFASGELKHGTIALIEQDTPVFAIITQANVAKNTRSGIEEVSARGANVYKIVSDNLQTKSDDFVIKHTNDKLNTLSSAVVSQYIAYYISLSRGLDVDKPRNLAKSVTVE